MKLLPRNLIFAVIYISVAFILLISLEAAQKYKGKIVSINTETFMFGTDAGLSGYIQYAPRLGQIIKPSIADSSGELIEMGTILSVMDISPWEAAYNASIADSSIDKNLVSLAYRNQNRYKFLAQRNAVSYKDLTNMDITLYNAIGQYMNNAQTVMMNKEFLDSCYAVAPFEGMITKLYFAQGQATNRPPIADIVQLNPIGVEIDIPMKILREISFNTPIKVVSPLTSDMFFNANPDFLMINEWKLTLSIPNLQMLDSDRLLTDTDIPVAREWSSVSRFKLNSSSVENLGVASEAIQKEDDKSFVWRAKGQKGLTANGIPNELEIEKIYIEPLNMTRYKTPYEKITAVKNSGKLDLKDIIIKNPLLSLQDGQKVYYPIERYLFMPGDEVEVIVGTGEIETNLTDSGISKE